MGKKVKVIYINEEYGQEVSIAGNCDADIWEVGHMLYGLLIAAGYAPKTVCKLLKTEECDE